MGSRDRDSVPPEELRRQAEARVREIDEDTDEIVSEVGVMALLHELQVHHIELEMQNEELLRARANAEDALNRYTDLFDFAPIGYLTLDRKGIIVESNLAGADLLGKVRSELSNSSFGLYVDPDSVNEFRDFLDRMLTSEDEQSCELRLRHGQFVSMIGSMSVQVDDLPVQCRVAVIDISVRKEAEALLRKSYDEIEDRVISRTAELNEARTESERHAAELQAVLESMADGVMLTDAKGHVTYVNDACMRIFEAPPDEAFEDWHHRIRRYSLDGEPMSYEQSAAYRALQGETVVGYRVRSVTPWGRDVTLELTASPMRDSEGRLLGAALVFHDISDRVDLEARRQELLEREHHIAEVLQQSLVPPQRQYSIGGYRIAVVYEAASREAEIGGDFYDVFELGDGKIGVLIGDVVGKGLSAAIRVAAARHAIRSYAFLDPSPAKVMTLANEALSREQFGDGLGMLTAIFAVLDANEGTFAYASAGHEPPFVCDCECRVVELDYIGRALGVLPGFSYPEASCVLRKGDVAVMVTDGITEAMDSNRVMFARAGVVEYLKQKRADSVEDIAFGLLENAKSYAGGNLRDDVAIVAFELVG